MAGFIAAALSVKRIADIVNRSKLPSAGDLPYTERSRRSSNMDCVVPNNISFQLLEEITNGFSEHRMIGVGSCGKVYMGVYKDGKRIAVKLLYGMPGLNDEQFQNEFNYLKRLDHQNIVRLVGYCNETKKIPVNHMGKLVLAEKRYTALCLEYMSNGSLDNYISDEYSGRSWPTRYKIIKGICEGLRYLHEELKPPIYHLDLKPANVLLDENMVPKISDFGLSKLFGEEKTQIIRNDRGTDAYSPPEYKKRGVVSMKFDIFSLGVVIMKIMAGRTGYCKNPDMSSEEFIELVHGNWKNRLQEKSKRGIEMEIYSAQIKTCIEIAARCVEYDRNKRPNIGDIVSKLNDTEINVLLENNITDFALLSEDSRPVRMNFPKNEEEISADMFFQQFQHVRRNGRNKPTPAEDRRRRSGKTRHIKSSSASRYTLMRNWKY